MLVKPSEFAAIKGVSRPTVCVAMKDRIKAAIVMRGSSKMLDRDLALELWDKNTKVNNNSRVSPERQAHNRRPAETMKPADAVKAAVMALPDDAIPGVDVSRERKEHYQAELAKLELHQKRKDLLPAEQIKREAFSLAKTIREALINIPDRVANQLAGETDPQAVHMTLTGEITQALERLANA